MADENLLRKVLVKRVDYLLGLYEASGELKHSGEKGMLRELFLRRVFEAMLPRHFAIGSGIIVDYQSRQSPQVDLIIFDTRRMPPALDEGGHGIYPIDSVMRAIEVKSDLDTAALVQTRKLSWILHPANPEGLRLAHDGKERRYPLVSLFAYTSSLANLGAEVIKNFKDFGSDERQGVFCSADRKQVYSLLEGARSFDTIPEAVIDFTGLTLNAIEVTADSRHQYELATWLGIENLYRGSEAKA